MKQLAVYNILPIYIQNYICGLQGRKLVQQRMGGMFNEFLKQYIRRGNWSFSDLANYRDQRIAIIVKHAYETVPYYNNLFNKLRLKPSDFKSIEDLKKLPVLTKNDVRNSNGTLVSAYYKKKLIRQTTSGSTGTGLELFYTPELLQEQFALWWKYRINLGITTDTWCADFGSRTIVPLTQQKPPFWRISEPLKQVKFSAFHGNSDNFYEYYLEIKKRRLTWIHGYPTIITPFAAYLVENNLSLSDQIQYVTTGGENLYDFQRKLMFAAFGTYPYSHYGLAECVANFSEDKNHALTVDEDFAAVEFFPNGDTYKIIGTSLGNFAMPLLRYDTGDLAVLFEYESRNGKRKVDHIDGRNGEYILLKSGKRVGALSALFTETKSIIEAQLHQKTDYSVEIKYVSNLSNNLVSKDLERVSELLKERLGNEVSFHFTRVNKIERTARGKLRYIISDLDPSNLAKSGLNR